MAEILLIEDEEHLRDVITLNLELEGYTVTGLEDGKQIPVILEHKNFSLVLLDVMLPDRNGFELCSIIKSKRPGLPVMFLTARGSSEDRIQGLRTGADDYLPKPFHIEELILRVKNLVKRTETGSSVFNFQGNSIDFSGFSCVNSRGERFDLSKREAELLKILADKKDQVVSRDEILEQLWPDGSYPSPRVIDNYILNFRKMFEKGENKLQHFQSVRGVGYRFLPDGDSSQATVKK